MPVIFKNMVSSFRRLIKGMQRPSKKRNDHLLKQRGETLNSYSIREATIDDVPALAVLHVTTWNQTYAVSSGGPTVELRENQWREKFNTKDDSWFVLLVLDPTGKLVGFANGNRYHDDGPNNFEGQLNKIYLLTDYQRLGLGRRLFCAVVKRFKAMGIRSMVLFGIADNPSGAFHESMEGERLYSDKGTFDGGYGWTDLDTLTRIC
jgi:ribosomal protein S18 acetylase RimI-like enzyme